MKVLCYGDSNTWGFDPRGIFADRYEKSWCDLLAEKTGWEIVGGGSNGRSLPGSSRWMDSYLRKYGGVKRVLILMGTNDILQGRPGRQILADMDALLEHLQTAWPEVKVTLLSPPPIRILEENFDARLAEVAAGYGRLAEKRGIPFVDTTHWDLPMAFDGVHLSEMGHRVFAEKLIDRIGGSKMLAYTYIEQGKFELIEKPKPTLLDDRDAIVKVTLGSICSSDLHIKHGSVPRAVPGITVGHEMVGIVEQVGSAVTTVQPGDRVTVNVETFCGECFFCQHGWVNNCTDPHGGWALGCRMDGGQAEFVRVPYADQGLDKIPDSVTDLQALLVGDVLATGYWAAQISEIGPDDTVLIIGAGPTGLCTLQCVRLKNPRRIIVCDIDESRLAFVRAHYPEVLTTTAGGLRDFVLANSDHGGADVVLEVAGSEETFQMAWRCARPNAIVTVVAMYNGPQTLPLPDMYGKNLTFKTGGVDGCNCAETLRLIAEGKLDTTPLITHTYELKDIAQAYELFEGKQDGVIKVAVKC